MATNDNLHQLVQNGDNKAVKKYIMRSFCKNIKKRPQKSFHFYKTLTNLYEHYPDTIQNLVISVPQWGYPKDYMLLLLASQNDELDKFVYNHIAKVLVRDNEKYNEGKSISSLAKWVPREKSSFDKKLNFVDKISKLLFPDTKDKFKARTEYRKFASKLNKYMGTIEIYLCSKEYDKIDFKNISPSSLRRYFNTFINNETTREKLREHLQTKYAKQSLIGLVHMTLNNQITSFEKEVIDEVWKVQKDYLIESTKSELAFDIKDFDVVIDMSKSIYDNGFLKTVINVCILVISCGNKIIINAYKPFVLKMGYSDSTGLIDIIETIKGATYNYKTIKVDEVLKLTDKKIIIMTDKDFSTDLKSIYLWNLKYGPLIHNPENRRLTGSLALERKSFRKKKFNKNRMIIKSILDNSKELVESYNIVLEYAILIIVLAFVIGYCFIYK